VIERYLNLCWEHPRRLITVVSALTVLLAILSFGRLDFDASRESLFKASPQEQARKAEFERRFGSWKSLVLVVDGSTVEERERTVLKLGEMISKESGVEDCRFKVDLPGMDRLGLYFLTTRELENVDAALESNQAVLELMSREGWYGFLDFVHSHLEQAPSENEHRQRLTKVWEQAVKGRGAGALDPLFPRVALPSQRFFPDGRTRHLIFFRASDPIGVRDRIRAMTSQLGFDGRIVLTGQPLLQAEERRETIRDASLSTLISVIAVQIILIWGFAETTRPRLAFLSLIFGLFWSVSWAALVVGSLNIITVNFLSITVGLGVDFSIHILARYTEEKNLNGDSVTAMAQTMRTTGVENLTGAVATSLAFWALVFTDFQAVEQLGIITGVAVPLCFVSVVGLLPPLLFWNESRSPQSSARSFGSQGGLFFESWEQELRHHPRAWLAFFSVLVVAMAALGASVRFDYNLLNMQSSESEAVRYEREGGFTSLAAFVVADSPAEARELKQKLQELPCVLEVQTAAELLPQESSQKRPLVASIVKRISEFQAPSFEPNERPDWERVRGLAQSFEPAQESADWVRSLKNSGPGPVEDVWKQMQTHLHGELTFLFTRLAQQDTDFDLQGWTDQASDLKRFVCADGKTQLRVRARGSLWERAVLVDFLSQVETVTQKGIGPPFLIRGYLEQLRQSYFDAVGYAILAIVILLFLHFRALLPTIIALVPKVVGATGMFFAMACAGIDLNPANCMALPLTLGIGLVFGIHAVHRCLECPDALLVSGATGKAIALSGLTTIASFGTLMVATHPGIFSLGFVMAFGVAANMIATYLLIPPLVVVFKKQLI